MPTVAIAIFPGVQALDVAGPVDVFSEANRFIAPEVRYEVQLLSAESAPLRASNGMTLVADATFAEAQGPFDLALVAGGPALPHDHVPDPRLLHWLNQCGDALPPLRLDLHGRVRARPCGIARRPQRHDALAARGATGHAIS